MVALGWPIALSMYLRSRSRLHICRKSSQPISVTTAARSLPSYLWSGRTLHGGVRASPTTPLRMSCRSPRSPRCARG